MKKIELRIVGLSYSQAQSNSYALVLGELNGKRRLPIVIGHYEAQSIALELEKMKPSRPLTHDLFHNFADSFGIILSEVIITKFREGIFYATIVCSNSEKTIEIDSRTSDAVSLAVRFNCPIYTYEEIMQQAGIVFEEEEEAKAEENKEEIMAEGDEFEKYLHVLSNAELETELNTAIENEDYELASLIRDEMQKRLGE